MIKVVTTIFFTFVFSNLFSSGVKLVKSQDTGISFSFRTPLYKIVPLELEGENYYKIEINDMGFESDIGKPAIPIKYIYFAVPLKTKQINVRIISTSKRKFEQKRIVPVTLEQWHNRKIVEEDPSIYKTKHFFPNENYRILYDKIVLHQRIIKMALYPFHFNPVSNELFVYDSMFVSIEFVGTTKEKGKYRFLGYPTEKRLKKILVNYDNAKNWRDEIVSKKSSLLNYTPWYKIKTKDEGIYKIDYDYLKNHHITPENIDPRTIKIFNGGSAVQDYNLTNVPDDNDTIPYQIPVYVKGEDDGSFDKGDYILFYGISLSGWGKASIDENVPLYYNPYSDTNVYWLSWGGSKGKRMEIIDGTPNSESPYTPSCFIDTIHIEENHLCPAKSGFGWVWEEVTLPSNESSISRSYSFQIDNLYSDSFEFFTAVYGATTLIHNVELEMNGIPICDTSWGGLNTTEPFTWLCGGSNLSTGENGIKLIVHKSGGGDDIYLDYFEVYLYKNYRASNNYLRFSIMEDAPQDTTYEFKIYGFSNAPTIFDITSPFAPKRITDGQFEFGTTRFQIHIDDDHNRFAAACEYKTPLDIKEENPFSLRGNEKADYIIITNSKFYYAASKLAEWRKKHLIGVPHPSVRIVLLKEVYDNFSWGVCDPVAIRNFLYYTENYWQYPPGYVLLFGGGSYDYKNLFANPQPKNSIPVFETGDYVHFQELMNNNPCYEDFFADFTGDLLCDIPIGRITAVTQEDAGGVVEKIINYERNSLGSWRNNIILLTDDEFDYNGIDGLYRFHIPGMEDISSYISHKYNQKKVYLTEFPGTNPGTVPPGSKPKARTAFIDVFNKGGLLGIFLGHGNLRQLTHELVFYRTDINMLNNDYREPFFYFGSCSVGDFDRPDEASTADFLQLKSKRGAIATLACARTSGYPTITTLGKELVKKFLGNHDLAVGDGVLISKKNINFGKTYALFGDPATPLFPETTAVQVSLSSDSLIGGGKITITGQIVNESDFNGFLYISAFDSEKKRKHPVPTTSDTLRYILPGDDIFKGISQITNSKIKAEFFVPVGLDSGNTGCINLYIWNNDKESRFGFDSLITGNDLPKTDSTPPTIQIYFRGKLLTDGMSIPNNADIVGILQDESGIDITDREDRSILLAINGDYSHMKDLNNYFVYDMNSSTKGSFNYTLDIDTTLKTVKLEFSCYDNCKNQGIKMLNLNVFNGEEFSLRNVYNFPNPFKENTYFTFDISQESNVVFTVFTISGRKIYQRHIECKAGFNRIFWNGKDADGDKVANGIYFYKLEATATDEKGLLTNPKKVGYTGKIAVAR